MDLKDLYVKVECPYNKSHMILPLRMPYHLHRCRKNHPNMTMAVCPYNATHEVKAPELKYHMTHCPNRTLLERDMPYKSLQNAILGRDDKVNKGNTDLPRPVVVPDNRDDNLENWDEDDSPLDFRPQEITRRRNPNRRQIVSPLRIPQKQSKAASLTMNCGNDLDIGRIEHRVNGSDGDMVNSGNSNVDDSSQGTRSSSSSSSPSKDNVNGYQPNVLSSRLMQQQTPITDNRRPIFSIGRGRARPAPSSPSSELPMKSPSLVQRPGTHCHPVIRMGRGGVRPTFKS